MSFWLASPQPFARQTPPSTWQRPGTIRTPEANRHLGARFSTQQTPHGPAVRFPFGAESTRNWCASTHPATRALDSLHSEVIRARRQSSKLSTLLPPEESASSPLRTKVT